MSEPRGAGRGRLPGRVLTLLLSPQDEIRLPGRCVEQSRVKDGQGSPVLGATGGSGGGADPACLQGPGGVRPGWASPAIRFLELLSPGVPVGWSCFPLPSS